MSTAEEVNTLSGELRLRDSKLSGLKMAERRCKPRVTEPFPARVWGLDKEGTAFELDSVLDNMSSTGLYLRLPRAINPGAEVNLAIDFVNVNGRLKCSTAVVVGRILRDEPQADGRHGLAVAIKEHHFI